MVAPKRVERASQRGLSVINNSQSVPIVSCFARAGCPSKRVHWFRPRTPRQAGPRSIVRIGPKLGPGSSSRSTKWRPSTMGLGSESLTFFCSIKQPWAFGEIVLSWRSPFDIRLGHPDEPIDPFDLAGEPPDRPVSGPIVVKVRGAEMSSTSGTTCSGQVGLVGHSGKGGG